MNPDKNEKPIITEYLNNVSPDNVTNDDLVLPESEFSNSPTFLQDTDQLLEKCLEETSGNDNSCISDVQLPAEVPDTYDFEGKNRNEMYKKFELQNLDNEFDVMHLPLKKRKLTRHSGEEKKEEDEIRYPATPMISIAEIEELTSSNLRRTCDNNARPFKTPAEKKEMIPLPVFHNQSTDFNPITTGLAEIQQKKLDKQQNGARRINRRKPGAKKKKEDASKQKLVKEKGKPNGGVYVTSPIPFE